VLKFGLVQRFFIFFFIFFRKIKQVTKQETISSDDEIKLIFWALAAVVLIFILSPETNEWFLL
jgi:hypothetical protein